VVTVGVVGVPSSGIELVLKQISLLVAQIRVICKNGPQVDRRHKIAINAVSLFGHATHSAAVRSFP
jgi:hypothetical protein